MLSENKRVKDKKFDKLTGELETGFSFSRSKDKHMFYAIKCWKICY